MSDPYQLSRILHELAGAASMCWDPPPIGVFDSQKAIGFVEAAIKEIKTNIDEHQGNEHQEEEDEVDCGWNLGATTMASFDTEAFMRRLTNAAQRRGKTMKDVAVETGVSETTLSRMSTGKRVCDAASLAALSAWAGINPARFSGWAPPRRDEEAETRVRNTPLRAT